MLGFFAFVLLVCFLLIFISLSYFFGPLHCRSFFHLHHLVTCLIFQSFCMYGIIFQLPNAYLSMFVIYCIESTLSLIFGNWHWLLIFKRFIYICNEVYAEKGFMQQRFLKNNENNISRYVKLTLHYIHTQMEFQVRVRLIWHYYTGGKIEPSRKILLEYRFNDLISFIVLNATFSNISAISWRPVLVAEEAGVPGENHHRITCDCESNAPFL